MLIALNDIFFLHGRNGRLYLLIKCIPFIAVVTVIVIAMSHIRIALEISG